MIERRRELEAALAPLARVQRMVFFAGLPGVGKSLFIRELALASHAAGRTVHLLQWDVVRLAFASPAIAVRYPERNGVTHGIIRKAVGEWARGAILRWHLEYPDAAHILIGEVPLIGNRLLELVQAKTDDAEPLLAGPDAVFITPVPSVAVRHAITSARERTFSAPTHPRERGDAPPDLMQLAWQEVHACATAIGAGTLAPDGRPSFDPAAYAAVYRHLLRHRRACAWWVNAQLEPRTSVYSLDIVTPELAPTAGEASTEVARLERECTPEQIEQDVVRWFERV